MTTFSTLRHRVASVHDQIDKNLLKVACVELYSTAAGCQNRDKFDMGGHQINKVMRLDPAMVFKA